MSGYFTGHKGTSVDIRNRGCSRGDFIKSLLQISESCDKTELFFHVKELVFGTLDSITYTLTGDGVTLGGNFPVSTVKTSCLSYVFGDFTQ